MNQIYLFPELKPPEPRKINAFPYIIGMVVILACLLVGASWAIGFKQPVSECKGWKQDMKTGEMQCVKWSGRGKEMK